VGLTQSYRTRDLLVGPASDTVPIKLDLSKKKLDFKSLFSTTHRTLFHAKQQGSAVPSSKIAEKYKFSQDLSVRFQFVSYKETQDWIARGLTVEDLLLRKEFPLGRPGHAIKSERLWSLSETDDYHFALVLVELKDRVEGVVRYKTDRFQSEQIEKWVRKFLSTLESIEYSRSKILVSTMISRYLLFLFFCII
jgi:hypothetical protein